MGLVADIQAAVSLDGRGDLALADGQTVEIKRGPYTARFLRANPPSHFYATLTTRLRAAPTDSPWASSPT